MVVVHRNQGREVNRVLIFLAFTFGVAAWAMGRANGLALIAVVFLAAAITHAVWLRLSRDR